MYVNKTNSLADSSFQQIILHLLKQGMRSVIRIQLYDKIVHEVKNIKLFIVYL
jgi:hypothetical protein